MTDNSFEKIKKLMKIIGGKVIIVEDGKPTAVIINVDEYFKFEDEKEFWKDNSSEKELIEKINKEINVWKDRQGERRIKQLEMESNYGTKNNPTDRNNEYGNEIVIEKL